MRVIRTKILSAREAAETYGGQIRAFDFQPLDRSRNPRESVAKVSRADLIPVAEQIHPVIYRLNASSPGEAKSL